MSPNEEGVVENAPQAEETQSPAVAELSPEEKLTQAEQKSQEYYDALLRAKAEAENIRKRAQTDVANTHKYAAEKFATEILTVKDSLEAAVNVTEATLESYKNGVELTLKQLNHAFEKLNIREINPLNEKFDPHQHQAITMIPAEQPANTVVEVMQKGYSLHDRILRPAMVIVAQPKST